MTIDNFSVPAKIIQILDWYEVPELLLIEGPPSVYTLAVRSVHGDDPENTYVGGSMSPRRLREYANGKCDLRFAIAHASLRKFWRFEFNPETEIVNLFHIKRSNESLVSSLPEPGLFADDHEDIAVAKSFVPDTIEKFNVDGGWDLGEFSQFYSQVEDIYYISSDIDRFQNANVSEDERKVISDAFDRPWGGGGSYVAFYKKVANDNDFHTPLRVSGIEYNSPGHVSIYARSEPFSNVMAILQHYADYEAEVRKAASALGRFMSRAGMKAYGYSVGMMAPDEKKTLCLLAEKLSDQMPGISFSTLSEMTNEDVLIAAKVLESIYRRIERLYKYFDQGRVSHPSLDVR